MYLAVQLPPAVALTYSAFDPYRGVSQMAVAFMSPSPVKKDTQLVALGLISRDRHALFCQTHA